MVAATIDPTDQTLVETVSTTTPPVAPTTSSGRSVSMLWILLAQVPLFFVYGVYLWERPHYQFLPLAVGAAVILAVVRLCQGPKWRRGSTTMCFVFVLTALILQATALMLHSYWLIGAAFLLSCVSFIHAYAGWRGIFACWTSVALIALCVPPPFALDIDMVLGLRDLTSFLGSRILNTDWVHLPHLLNGNSIDIGGRQLFVEEACSGVNSLFSSLCCVLIWAGLTRMHWLEAMVLLVACVMWLIAANTLRIVLVAVSTTWWGIDLTTGWKHEALGIGTYALGLFLTWDTRQLMLFFFRPRDAANSAVKTTPVAAGALPSPKMPGSPIAGWGVLTATVLITATFVVAYRTDFTGTLIGDDQDRPLTEQLSQLTRSDMPAAGSGWKIDDFKVEKRELSSQFGENSRSWAGMIGSYKMNVSIDFPWQNWHDLTICYKRQGWEMESVNDVPSPVGEGSKMKEVVMKRPGFQSGYLIFAEFDAHGNPLTPPAPAAEQSIRPESLLGKLIGMEQPTKLLTSTYQVQVFVSGAGDADAEVRRAAADALKAAYEASLQRLPSVGAK